MAKKAKGKDYFGLPRVLSIILAIIRLIGIGIILWVVDLILVILNGRILRLLPI